MFRKQKIKILRFPLHTLLSAAAAHSGLPQRSRIKFRPKAFRAHTIFRIPADRLEVSAEPSPRNPSRAPTGPPPSMLWGYRCGPK